MQRTSGDLISPKWLRIFQVVVGGNYYGLSAWNSIPSSFRNL